MNKRKVLILLTAVSVALASAATELANPMRAAAESVKGTAKISGASYFGELKNGLPHGKGKLEWSSSKWYMGEFVQGKRSGTGKYLNQYIDSSGKMHRIVYNGEWKNDRMNGSGVQTEDVSNENGQLYLKKFITGTFANNTWVSGYNVGHVLGDPDYSYLYKGNGITLWIWDTNLPLMERWKNGSLFRVQYQKGSVYRDYSMFTEESTTKEKARLEALRYLQSVTSQVEPHLKKFQELAKQVPIEVQF
ncbi:hypothetical protein B9G55_22330 [Saccharibacillus sp. O16]|nr:hypothetical protein B9G55_22330 [Saccharibacillus sp. O16]